MAEKKGIKRALRIEKLPINIYIYIYIYMIMMMILSLLALK